MSQQLAASHSVRTVRETNEADERLFKQTLLLLLYVVIGYIIQCHSSVRRFDTTCQVLDIYLNLLIVNTCMEKNLFF